VIGNGNVAIDVVRMLARSPRELQETDIADYALEALLNSNVKEIFMLGRRGPVQAKFTNPEIKELEEMDDANIRIYPSEIELDPMSQEYILSGEDRNAERNYQALKVIAQNPTTDKPKTITLRFLVSPVEIMGTNRVEGIKLVQNEICDEGDGAMSPCNTDDHEIIKVGLVFRSIGYHGVPLPGVPFDRARGVIPNTKGRVVDEAGKPIPGEYVVGWIKRGPTGIIGTNKPDAQDTAARILEDVEGGSLPQPDASARETIEDLLANRQVAFVTYADWQIVDQIEQERGALVGRPRLKYSRVEDMLAALAEAKSEPARLQSRSNGKQAAPERSAQVAKQPDLQPGSRRDVNRPFWHNKQTIRQDH
jgi:ferredoxin/flavodoxin---NADP+ reductase